MLQIQLFTWKITWDVNFVIFASEMLSILQIYTPSLQVFQVCAHIHAWGKNVTYMLQYV